MKTLSYLFIVILFGFVMLVISCQKEDDPPEPPQEQPPIASFTYQSGSAVVNEYFQFSNSSTGNITSYNWNFGTGEGSSSQSNPNHKFVTIGNKTITLTVSGPGGTDSQSKELTVYTMPPDCHNYSNQHNMNEGVILNLRDQGAVEYGRLVIINNYAANVEIEIYHPDNWLNDNYKPWNGYLWTVSSNLPDGIVLLDNNNYFTIGSDWGIRVTFGNGVKSCIRTIQYYFKYFNIQNNGYLKVYASDIYENENSWYKSGNIEEPANIANR